ncbi:hypothetical protein LSAT2_005158 [Lamellibrachia satsuma]|nr:hypothetical protein LSAT2_005158 [Lamellibrachia satsuma]
MNHYYIVQVGCSRSQQEMTSLLAMLVVGLLVIGIIQTTDACGYQVSKLWMWPRTQTADSAVGYPAGKKECIHTSCDDFKPRNWKQCVNDMCLVHRLPKRLFYSELQKGKRSQGGQKKRFKHNMKISVKAFAINPTPWNTLLRTVLSGAPPCTKDLAKWRSPLYKGPCCVALLPVQRAVLSGAPPVQRTVLCGAPPCTNDRAEWRSSLYKGPC